MDTSRYALLFQSEAREHLTELDGALLALERGTPTSEEVPARLNGIFRSLHTLKGSAATMGYRQLERVAHALESRADELRRAPTVPAPDTLALLLEGTDLLRRTVDAIALGRGEPSELIDPFMGRLEGRLARDDDSAVGRPTPRAVPRLPRLTPLSMTAVTAPPLLDASAGNASGGAPAGGASSARTVRLEARRLDTLLELVGDLVVARERLTRVLGARGLLDEEVTAVMDEAATAIATLQQEVLDARLLPVSFVFDRFPRLVRDVARTLGKTVSLVTEGRDQAMDRAVLDAVGDPLVHLIRNAIDHGLEAPAAREAAGKPAEGRLTLRALREGPAICIEVEDDGAGIDRERVLAEAGARGLVSPTNEALDDDALLDILSHPGFTTAPDVTTVSGRGVGIDAVRARVRSLGGQLELRSERGVGTRFTLRLPVSVAISRALVVEVQGAPLAIPVALVEGTEAFVEAHALVRDGVPQVVVADGVIPMVDLRALWTGVPSEGEGRQLVRVAGGGRQAALLVETVVGVQDIVVRPLAAQDAAVSWWGGSTALGDGRLARIVDLSGL